MKVMHVDEAAANLQSTIESALNGEDIYIYLDNPERRVRLVAGNAGHLFWMSDDFDAPVSDFKEYMYEEPLIRPYEERDQADLIMLLTELQCYEQALDSLLQTGSEDLSTVYLGQILQKYQSQQGMICVAERDQQIVGMISFYHAQSGDILTRAPNYLYISDLVVTATYRNQNIATHLIQRAEAYARELGIQYVRLYVLTRNEAALGAYRKAGYVVDLLGMIKVLDQTA